jgi:hypothetical protein
LPTEATLRYRAISIPAMMKPCTAIAVPVEAAAEMIDPGKVEL